MVIYSLYGLQRRREISLFGVSVAVTEECVVATQQMRGRYGRLCGHPNKSRKLYTGDFPPSAHGILFGHHLQIKTDWGGVRLARGNITKVGKN